MFCCTICTRRMRVELNCSTAQKSLIIYHFRYRSANVSPAPTAFINNNKTLIFEELPAKHRTKLQTILNTAGFFLSYRRIGQLVQATCGFKPDLASSVAPSPTPQPQPLPPPRVRSSKNILFWFFLMAFPCHLCPGHGNVIWYEFFLVFFFGFCVQATLPWVIMVRRVSFLFPFCFSHTSSSVCRQIPCHRLPKDYFPCMPFLALPASHLT
jgi:hypothetical protein